MHLGKGYEALNNSRFEEAVREFRAALALDPRLVMRARFPLAVALFDLQERDEARKEFETVRSEVGDDINVAYYLGRLDLAEGRLDLAIGDLSKAAARPPFPDTAYYLGYAYLKRGEAAAAEKWLKKAAELAPRDFRVHERLGLLYRSAGRQDEAKKAFALSVELHKSDVEATEQALACGRSLETRPLEEARAVCQKLFDPGDVGKLVTLGMTYGRHGNYLEAWEPFRRAAELDPDAYENQYNLGLTSFRLKRYAEARAPLEKAMELRPDLFEVVAPLGAVLYALGDDLPAYQVLSHAHLLNPQSADVAGLLFKLALPLAQRSTSNKDYRTALQYLLTAVELHPDDAEVHRHLAEVYGFLGESGKAAQERQEVDRIRASGH